MRDLLHLRSEEATASIALDGAELRSWTVAGQDLIWTPDTAIWAESAPILFPVVGWTRGSVVRIEGRTYPIGLHGFARTSRFAVADHGPDWVRLAMEASSETRTLYPFDFALCVTYRLVGSQIRTELAVRNRGATAMPYACGLHPGFRWPFAGGDRESYALTFAEEEVAAVPVISSEGLFTRERREVPMNGRRLLLSEGLFAREALCFLGARSRSMRFGREGGAEIRLIWDGFPHIALWSRSGGRFLAIEAWTGHGDFADSDGDLWNKPSMIHLAAGVTRYHAATYDFVPCSQSRR